MERAQAHTLEGFTAAVLIVAGMIFALQATAVTPLSASTSNQHIENQQRVVANDLLAASADNGSLREAVTHWNASENRFPNTGSDGYYTNGGPPNAFGKSLNETFHDRRIAFNVYVDYHTGESVERQALVYMGTPSDNAVVASRTVILFNETRLTAPGATQTLSEAWETDDFYAPDVAPGSELYNVVEVRIVTWRM